jgi:hypothetical protein
LQDGAKKYSDDNVLAAVTDFATKLEAYKAVFDDESDNKRVEFVASNVVQATNDLLGAMNRTGALLPRLLHDTVEVQHFSEHLICFFGLG